MRFALLISLTFIVGCTTKPIREFNSDDLQDPDCYKSFGGIKGYCDRPLTYGVSE